MANGTTCCSNEHYRLIKLPRNEYMKTQTVKSLNAAPTWNKLNGRAKLISISLSFRGLPDENKCLSWASRLIKMNSKLSIGFVHCITLEEELWPLKNICLTALKVLKNRVHGVPLLPHYWRRWSPVWHPSIRPLITWHARAAPIQRTRQAIAQIMEA